METLKAVVTTEKGENTVKEIVKIVVYKFIQGANGDFIVNW